MTKSKLELISIKSAEILLDIGSININTNKLFKLTSGKLSPIYCDCRRIISFPKQREKLMNFGVEIIRSQKSFSKITNISGGETAGIPFASFLSTKLNLPMTYIRKDIKKFGGKKQIEGIVKKNSKVILVEDLITDGGSKLNFVNALTKVNAKIDSIFVIFNYGIYEKFIPLSGKKISLLYLTSWKSILEVCKIKKILDEKQIKVVKIFLKELGVKN